MHPAAVEEEFPTLLEFPAPRLLCFSRESAVAEKFEAMVRHGELNSRMKDFYDVWLLSRSFAFDGPTLAEAIRRTFASGHLDVTVTRAGGEPVRRRGDTSSILRKEADGRWRVASDAKPSGEVGEAR